ncbi:MAG: hypothetical protein Q7R52_05680 [archaeon]|nr:hypothetical protein [archaeon]
MEYAQPNNSNVTVEDLLFNSHENEPYLLPIVEIRDCGVTAKNTEDTITANYPYIRAIIKTKDGRVLVGEGVGELEIELFEITLKNLEGVAK